MTLSSCRETHSFSWVGDASHTQRGGCSFLLPGERLLELDEQWRGNAVIQAPVRSAIAETYPVRISTGFRRDSDV